MRIAAIVLGCFALASCRAANSAQDTTSASRSGERDRISGVNDAFLAKLGGWGGCGRIDRVDSIPNRYIDGATLLRGRCTTEHGDTLESLVAVDTSGGVFLQNSIADYAYLLRRHPLRGGVNVGSVDYAAFALKLSGLVAPDANIVFTKAELPIATQTQLQSAGFPTPLSSVVDSEPAANVVVTAAHADTLREYKALFSEDGQMMILNHKLLILEKPK